MKIALALICAIVSASAFAAPDPHYCEMVGSLAKGITEDRDRGVSYQAELGKLKGATGGLASTADIFTIAKTALKVVYLDMPKLTPVGAYKLHYVACMAS
jgi:hypothetical protein